MDNPSGDKRPKTNSTMFNKYSLNKAFAPNEPHSDSDASDTDAIKKPSISTLYTKAKKRPRKDEIKDDMKARLDKMHAVEDFINTPPIPNMITFDLATESSCIHTVSYPPTMTFKTLSEPVGEPAKQYPFTLDPFQKESVKCLENSESVLVSAHTSAGKTVIAEYAIALSLKAKQRVIYTTPIKALSNQKYREFLEEFEDVGLMTGDITINPNASCLIMTTEILRSMLYRGAEIMREMAWVIFDEIHYMRDKERGVVWEETIILLPDNVHYVFLSATIPNAKQFAEWITYLHKQPCHVVYTEYRPTPLQHYMYPAGADSIIMVVDEKGVFQDSNFNEAMSVIKEGDGNNEGDKKGRKGGFKDKSSCFKVVKMIMERDLSPAIIFSFSKKDCEAYATQMARLDFNSEKEKKLVEEVFMNAIDSLKDEDKALPQVNTVLPLLKKGVGIHHSGLLPILKEVIEILFGEGLIKALFATETFAMGLNMPARTVVFTNARKFDGKDFRWITSGEYIQMSGRAGRRGLDDKGIVIVMVDEKMSPEVGKNLLKGTPDSLNSAFHLTYNMVLNLLRVEEINPEYMMERSFHQFQNYSIIPGLVKRFNDLKDQKNSIKLTNEKELYSYHRLLKAQKLLLEKNSEYVCKPKHLLPFLKPGRLIRITNEYSDYGWGMVISFEVNKEEKISEGQSYNISTLLYVQKGDSSPKSFEEVYPCDINDNKGVMVVINVPHKFVSEISSVRMHFNQDLKHQDHRTDVKVSIQQLVERMGCIPLLDPVEDMNIDCPIFKMNCKRLKEVKKDMKEHTIHSDEKTMKQLNQYIKKDKILCEMEKINEDLQKKGALLKQEDLQNRKKVLRKLEYSTEEDVILTKGRVACEVGCGDELVITELLFSGAFNNLTSSECAALLSVFVLQEKSKDKHVLKDNMKIPLRTLQTIAGNIAKVSNSFDLDLEEEAYIDSFKPQMIGLVDMWCQGSSFASIIEMTDIFEGSIIRCMRRLEELLREMTCAAKNIGNSDLELKFSEAIKLLKRDIVFAASLYF